MIYTAKYLLPRLRYLTLAGQDEDNALMWIGNDSRWNAVMWVDDGVYDDLPDLGDDVIREGFGWN